MSDLIHFEDVEVGALQRYGRYEVAAEEIVDFARRFDPRPVHLDEAAARRTPFGGLVASGWHTGAMLMRMIAEHAVPGSATQGAMGFDDLRWLEPVRPGDVLTAESEIVGKTASPKRPQLGTVRIENRVRNQRGEVVMQLTSLVLYRRRAAAAP